MDLCAQHNIVPELQLMPCEKINEIYTLLDSANDSGVRYVSQRRATLSATVFGRQRLHRLRSGGYNDTTNRYLGL
jgi:hypothetical protein